MNTTVQQSAKSGRDLAKAIAKQIGREPLEILKTVKSQATGIENKQEQDTEAKTYENSKDDNPHLDPQKVLNDKIKGGRMMDALNRELKDISRERLFSDLQRKISEGTEIPLTDFPELSMEQKQVLKAQMEAFKMRESNLQNQGSGQLIEPASKKGRRLFSFGKKQEVKRQQTRVENVVPPSG